MSNNSSKTGAATSALKYSVLFIASIFLLSIALHFAYTNFQDLYSKSQHSNHPRNIHLKSIGGVLDTRRAKSITHEDESLWYALKRAVQRLGTFALGSLSTSPSFSITMDHEKQELRTFMFHLDHNLVKQQEQFEETKQALTALGVKIGHYIPHNTLIGTTSMNIAKQAKNSIKGLIWVGEMGMEHKMHNDELLRNHLDKHASVASRLDSEFSNSWEEKAKKQARRRLMNAEDKQKHDAEEAAAAPKLDDKDVEFFIHATVPKHESKQALEKEVQEWENMMRKEITGITHLSLIVPSTQKIALGVHGKDNAYKVAKWLSTRGLVHWVEVCIYFSVVFLQELISKLNNFYIGIIFIFY